MILTTEILLSFGLPIDRGIPTAALETAITNAEVTTVIGAIGVDHYNTVAALDSDDPLLCGGTVEGVPVAGYNRAAAHLAFAHLLVGVDTQATAFGSVKKKDDYSDAADWFRASKYHERTGLAFLKQLCDVEGWEYVTPDAITVEG